MTYLYDLFGAGLIALVPVWVFCATVCAIKNQIQDFVRFCREEERRP